MPTRNRTLAGSTKLRVLFVATSLLLTGGCVPLPAKVTYIAPEPAPGLELVSSTRGPKDVVRFKVSPDITMTLIVFDEANGNMVRLYFSLPEGRSFQFDEEYLTVKSPQSNQVTHIKLEKILTGRIINNVGSAELYEPKDKIVGATFSVTTTSMAFTEKQALLPRRIQVEAKVTAPLPQEFDLYLPTFKLDGQPFVQPPIRFIRRSGTFLNLGGPW